MVTDKQNIYCVVKGNLCVQCGTCVSICPENCISLERNEKWNYVPKVNEEVCTNCGLCLRVCPGREVDFTSLSSCSNLKGQKGKGGHRYIGDYLHTFLGYSTEKEVRENASSGGIVPAILLYLLETKIVDGVLITRARAKDPFNPEVFIATSREEIFGSMQSKYHPVPLNTMLQEINKIDGKFAVVGLPCHIHGIRKYESLDKGLKEKIFLKIGIFCGLNLRFDSLEFFAHKVGENVRNLEKVLYREGRWPGEMVLQFRNDKSYTLDKNIVNHVFTLPRCMLCTDQTNELADISCGDAWLPELLERGDEGWSVIISRSPRGDEILNELREKNKIYLKEASIDKVIDSQSGMLRFKKENFWIRLKLSKAFGMATPEYSSESLNRTFKASYLIGSIILIFIVHLMRSNKIKNLIKVAPIRMLKAYEMFILELLYTKKPLSRIGRKITKKLLQAKNLFIH